MRPSAKPYGISVDKDSPKRKRSASKPLTPLGQMRGAVGQKKDWAPLRWALESAKNDAGIPEFRWLYSLAVQSPMLPAAFSASRPSIAGANLQRVAPLETADIYREVAWASVAIASSRERIEKYVPMRSAYEVSLMNGDFDKAYGILERIDRVCGISLWAIENRIALLAAEGGFEKQKTYVDALAKKYKRSFISFYATNIGERNELHVSRKGYETRLRERAKNWEISVQQSDYILFKLLGKTSGTLSAYASLLAYEGASSVIDLYELFVTTLCAISNNPALKKSLVSKSIRALDGIADQSLLRIKILYSDDKMKETFCNQTQCTSPPYIEYYLSGDYEACAVELALSLKNEPNDSTAVRLSGQLAALGFNVDIPNSPLLLKLCDLFVRHCARDESAVDASDELEKLALNLRNLSFASSISLSPNVNTPTVPSLLPPMSLETAVRTSRLTPQAISLLFGDVACSFYATAATSVSNASTYEQLVLDSGFHVPETIRFSTEARTYGKIAAAVRRSSFEKALAAAKDLEASCFQYYQLDAAVIKALLLYLDGALAEALEQSVRLLVTYPSLSRALPLTQIVRTRGFRDFKTLRCSLALPIAFYLFGVNTQESIKDVALKVAWRQFLSCFGINRPSLLSGHEKDLSREELIFFLRDVCIQEVMELGGAFSSPVDLDQERARICILLTTLDSERASDYNTEIIELTRRLSIEEGVKLLESSRVYVDVAGLEKWSQLHLTEIFLRYVDYAGADLNSSSQRLERTMSELLKGGKRKELANFLDNYDITADSLLQEAIDRTANAFESLPRYGLDAFLGSRVRHGSLEISFRSPLERRRLLTKIDSKSGDYERNSYWLDSMEGSDPVQLLLVEEIFKQAARDIDAILDSAVNQKIYVRSATHPEGLISVWPSDASKQQVLQRWVVLTKLQLTSSVTVKQFLDHCVNALFWQSLAHSLLTTQTFIKITLCNEILDALDRLRDQIVDAVPTGKCAGMLTYIQAASAEIETAAGNVAKWFNPPRTSKARARFPLKTGIEIGLRSIRAIKPLFDPILEWDVDPKADVLLSPEAFEMINDLSFLIFGNVSRHSGFEERGDPFATRCKVRIKISSPLSGIVELRVESDIAPGENVEVIDQKVKTAKAAIASREYDDFASRHRGTGLVRLASTMNYEDDSNRKVDFGRVGERVFYVDISVPAYLLSPEAEESFDEN